MADPLDRVADASLKADLERIRGWNGEVLAAADLAGAVRGFQGQKGIYRPAGAAHALWVRQTLRGAYTDDDLATHPDGSWTYRYAPEARNGATDLHLPTNQGLLRCRDDGVPVGVFRQVRGPGPGVRYEVLGLAFVEAFDGTHFVLRGEAIDFTAAPVPEEVVPVFRPFEPSPTATEEVVRRLRDHRFGVAVRRIYHERCSLCDVGYRLRGQAIAVDAAHIVPVDRRGNLADVRNGILLCKNHHALFDHYAWTMDEELTVRVSEDREFRRSAAANHVLRFEGRRLANLPSQTEDLPAREAIRWRLDEFART